MRKVIDDQSRLGSVDIGSIKLDVKSRDEMPALLIGLQAIRGTRPCGLTCSIFWTGMFFRTSAGTRAVRGCICGGFW